MFLFFSRLKEFLQYEHVFWDILWSFSFFLFSFLVKKWIYSGTERSTLHRQNVGQRRGRVQPRNLAWLAFTGWVISYANELGGLFQLFWGRGGDFQVLGHRPLLGVLTVPWNCPGTSGCVISLAD